MGGIGAAFEPPGEQWVRVSSRLRTVRRITLLLLLVPLTALGVLLAEAFGATAVGILVAVVAVAIGVVGWSAVERNWRAWGYAERADDLLVVRGVLTRRLVVVPYGRMQFVDVTAGPVVGRCRVSAGAA